MTLEATEAECAVGRTAPRVSLSDIEAEIRYRFDMNAGDAIGALHGHKVEPDGSSSMDSTDLLSICLLVMRNGFVVICKSAPASPANFDAALGRKLAYEDAVRQAWPLLGYHLRCQLHENAK